MSAPFSTMLLDGDDWDLVLDANGNWAVAEPPYALAQDAASEIRTFLSEVYYDLARGIPYPARDLGRMPSVSLLKSQFNAAAMLVPGVTAARTFLTGTEERRVTGQVQVTDSQGNVTAAGF